MKNGLQEAVATQTYIESQPQCMLAVGCEHCRNPQHIVLYAE